MKTGLSQERLQEVLHYSMQTGVFTWKIVPRQKPYLLGKEAGCLSPAGYKMIRVDGELYRAHRLAWLYVYGRWPADVDHANGDKADNRLSNLRECTMSQNIANARRRRDNTSGHKGVWRENSSWTAEIWHKGKKHRVGVFKSLEQAVSARAEAAARLFGEFARS